VVIAHRDREREKVKGGFVHEQEDTAGLQSEVLLLLNIPYSPSCTLYIRGYPDRVATDTGLTSFSYPVLWHVAD
jgi:hypothetical protein